MVRVVAIDGSLPSNYSTSGISRRTGLSRHEIEELKRAGREDIEERGGFGDTEGISFSAGIGSFGVGRNARGEAGVSVEALGFGIEYDESGGGSISFPGGISVSTSVQGCYLVQVHEIFGQTAFTNIKKRPRCGGDDDTGKPKGNGPATNEYPECLDDSRSHVFYWTISSRNSGEEELTDGSTFQDGIKVLKYDNSTILTIKNINENTWDRKSTLSATGMESVTNTDTANGFYYYGTLGSLKAHHKDDWNLPRDDESEQVFWNKTTRTRSKMWAVVGSPDGDCNPSGDKGSDNNNNNVDFGDSSRPDPRGLPKRPNQRRINRKRRQRDNMNRECCGNVKKIAKVLAADEVLKKGLVVPGRLVAYGATKKITAKSYLEIAETQIRIADNLGIHPIEITLQDSNNSKEGDQELSATFINATAAIKQLLELGLESKGDSADRLGILFRIAWINVQILNSVVVVVRGIQGVMQYIGMPIREKVEKVWMPFDVFFGKRTKFKGFNPEKKKPDDSRIKEIFDLRDEDSMEKVLPEFLNSSQQPVIIEEFAGNITLVEAIRQLIKH